METHTGILVDHGFRSCVKVQVRSTLLITLELINSFSGWYVNLMHLA